MKLKLLFCALLLCFYGITLAGDTNNKIPPVPEGALQWSALINTVTRGPNSLLYSEGIIPGWKGETIAAYEKNLWVTIPFTFDCASSFKFTISYIVGGRFSGFEVFLNNRRIGTVNKAGDTPRLETLTFTTPPLPHNSNTLLLRPLGEGIIALRYLHWLPQKWVTPKPQDWAATNALDENNGLLTLNAGSCAHTWLFTPQPSRPYIIETNFSAPAKILINGQEITGKNNRYHIPKLPQSFNRITVEAPSNKKLKFSLRITTPGDNIFTKDVPQYFTCLPAQLKPGFAFPTVTLKNNQLQLRIALPDEKKGYYRSSRFENAGMVYSAKFKGTEFFTTSESEHNPVLCGSCSGSGDEFSEPLGYDEAKVGDTFIKIGVGTFTKPVWSQYFFYCTPLPAKRFAWKHSQTENSVTFEQDIREGEWGYRYRKTVKLAKNKPVFEIHYELQNTGTKIISTNHYSHNFIRIGENGANSGYSLIFNQPVKFQFEKYQDNKVEFKGAEFVVNKIPRVFFARYLSDKELDTVRVHSKKAGKSVELYTSAPLSRGHLFISPRLISPEFFVKIRLKPGEKKIWTRRWSFFDK